MKKLSKRKMRLCMRDSFFEVVCLKLWTGTVEVDWLTVELWKLKLAK